MHKHQYYAKTICIRYNQNMINIIFSLFFLFYQMLAKNVDATLLLYNHQILNIL